MLPQSRTNSDMCLECCMSPKCENRSYTHTHAYMNVCIYEGSHILWHSSMLHACKHTRVYVCVSVYLYIHKYKYIQKQIGTNTLEHLLSVFIQVTAYLNYRTHTRVCVYVCVCVSVYLYIHKYTYTCLNICC
jgi:hypothetical protein